MPKERARAQSGRPGNRPLQSAGSWQSALEGAVYGVHYKRTYDLGKPKALRPACFHLSFCNNTQRQTRLDYISGFERTTHERINDT